MSPQSFTNFSLNSMPSEDSSHSPIETRLIQNRLNALVEPQMGVNLAFSGHEDGGLLEPLVWHPAEQGEFNCMTLMQSEHWVNELTVSEAIAAWQAPEQIGAVSGEEWLIPEQDPAQILPNPATQAEHQALDAELLDLLRSRLHSLQALKLSCDPNYAVVLVLGQLADSWIGVAPTVPIATALESLPLSVTPLSPTHLSLADPIAMLQLQIQTILARRGSVKLYGYYGGGYNQTHDYRLVQATGRTKAEVIQALMQATGLLRISRFEAFQPSSTEATAKFAPLEQLLQSLQPLVYQFSFWDWEQVYVIGEALDPTGDRMGVVLRSHFTYNP